MTYRLLALAGAIVAFGTGLVVILAPRHSSEYATLAGVFVLGCVGVFVIEGWLAPRKGANDPVDGPVSEGVGRGIANTVVLVLLVLIALVTGLLGTALGVAVLALSTGIGGFLIARRSKIRFLLPYAIAAVISVFGMLGYLAVAKALAA